MHHKYNRAATTVLFFVALSGCGQGGSGGTASDDPWGDGLGTTGRVSGTVRIAANGTIGHPSVTLDDSGRALAVWSNGDKVFAPGDALVWSRSDAAGQWEAPRVLEQTRSFVGGGVLRTNPDGNSVLGWVTVGAHLLRYSPDGGWSASKLDMPSLRPLSMYPDADLTLLSEGTIVFSAGNTATITRDLVMRGPSDDDWVSLLEIAEQSVWSYLAATPDGRTGLFWIETRDAGGSDEYALKLNYLDVFDPPPLSPWIALIEDGQYVPCFEYTRPLLAVTAGPHRSVVAVSHNPTRPDPGWSGCDLDLISVDLVSPNITRRRMNSPGFIVPHTPILRMNEQGDAIAIWSERSVRGDNTRRVLWAQSIQGGSWSEAKPVIADSAALGEIYPSTGDLGFAMNRSGRAVAAVKALQNARSYINVARFSFNEGWTNWRKAAAMRDMSFANVAINVQGEGVLVYGATPCERLPTTTGGGVGNCGPPEMYALRF